MSDYINRMKKIWKKLYDKDEDKLEIFLEYLKAEKEKYKPYFNEEREEWFKDAVIYSLYVDLFNNDISGLNEKLDYLQKFGINCIWLLPVLDSPMKDAGFDISDYKKIRETLLGNENEDIFDVFLEEAHKRDIRVIFDIALNHCSTEHEWFKKAVDDEKGKYHDYFIWSDTTEKYKEARIIFKGLCKSNWEWEPKVGKYYFHRFFEMQPDLNYRNPELLIEMSKVLIYWKLKHLDGFRADAIPYIWKEEGTICENLEKTHDVVKFFRAILDYIDPGTLLLAEACQPPKKVVEYFGEGDECNGAYHFPVMPRIYRSLAEQSSESIKKIMSPEVTPSQIPEDSQWFMFLRCHDELTLEMVTTQEREFIFDYYAQDPSWSFRNGEGISARLATLFGENEKLIKLAYSIMFTLTGTPIIFYGDEFAKTNDVDFYNEQVKETGIKDSRYLVRGRVNWPEVENKLDDSESLSYKIFSFLKNAIEVRKNEKTFGNGDLKFLDIKDENGVEIKKILAYDRIYNDEIITVIQNLSDKKLSFKTPFEVKAEFDLLGSAIKKEKGLENNLVIIEPFDFYWIKNNM